jgi:two-component system phosphate regulon sensor histidine kinase PhoR
MARSIFRQILVPLVLVAAMSSLLMGAGAYLVLDHLYEVENEASLDAAVQALAAALPEAALAEAGKGTVPGGAAAAWCREVSAASQWRLTLVAPDGGVLADTMADPASMENHASRPEVAAALAGRTMTAHRRSATLGRELFYAAAPVLRGGEGRVAAVLRLAADLPAMEARLVPWRFFLALDVLVVGMAAIAAAWLFSRRISSPLGALASAARRVEAGERTATIPRFPGPEEVSALASSLASMASELDRRAREAEAEGRERKAILDGMSEAVLALDSNLVVRMANAAARRLFAAGAEGTSAGDPAGLTVLRATRSTELEEAARTCLGSGRTVEREMPLYGASERWFQAFLAPLHGSPAGYDGVVLVLNDITKLRRLERIRKDFVANVSHELRTPIQLIKGFSEVLAEELAEADSGGESRRHVEILSRNASRMESLIADLLTLARLEQEGADWLECEESDMAPLLAEAQEAVAIKARERDIGIEASCEEGLRARVNGGLFVQAAVNLLDNAVKYSPRGSTVKVSAQAIAAPPEAAGASAGVAGWFSVTVTDQGPGIPARDLPRLFERFYRVDKARSREAGGTGLGLAIVRHIALVHGGSVKAESWEGEGSRFTMILPLGGPDRAPGMQGEPVRADASDLP